MVLIPQDGLINSHGKVFLNKIDKVKKKLQTMSEAFLMGRDGFEPSKQVAADLQSVPFGHSGICPCDQHLPSITHYLHYDKCFITVMLSS